LMDASTSSIKENAKLDDARLIVLLDD